MEGKPVVDDNLSNLLIHLAEECSEVIKSIMKIQRLGLDTIAPTKNVSNRQLLLDEIEDVKKMIKKVKENLKENGR
jgi:hypothetical protein